MNIVNIVILVFSTGGVMGWAIWENLPLASCIIIAAISLLKLLQPHFIASEKNVDKLDKVTDFYFEYLNKLEELWFNYYARRINDSEAQEKFYEIKRSEKEINKVVTEIIKTTNKKVLRRTDVEARNYLKRTFNTE